MLASTEQNLTLDIWFSKGWASDLGRHLLCHTCRHICVIHRRARSCATSRHGR